MSLKQKEKYLPDKMWMMDADDGGCGWWTRMVDVDGEGRGWWLKC